jgi:hypothetical protein
LCSTAGFFLLVSTPAAMQSHHPHQDSLAGRLGPLSLAREKSGDSTMSEPLVAGTGLAMTPGVRTALIEVFRMNSEPSTDRNNWRAGLRAEVRFLEDIWGG